MCLSTCVTAAENTRERTVARIWHWETIQGPSHLPEASTNSTFTWPTEEPALPIFHAFTGCNTVSFFDGKVKKSACDTWNVFPAHKRIIGDS